MIFISYRREGGRDIARNIYERLSISGYTVFFDYNSIRDNEFNIQIYKAIEKCTDFILILSPNALDRCSDENDWVRSEIECAIKHGKHIIPLVTEGFTLPENLPESIASISNIQFSYIYNNCYEENIKTLKKRLKDRNKYKTILKGAVIVAALIAVGLLYNILKPVETSETFGPGESRAQLYLIRYSDLNMQYANAFNDSVLDVFRYEDRMDSAGNTFVYPVSGYLNSSNENNISIPSEDSIFFHNPVIRLKMHNKQNKTVVFCNAEIEIKDYQPLSNTDSILLSNSLDMESETNRNVTAYKYSESDASDGNTSEILLPTINICKDVTTYTLNENYSIKNGYETRFRHNLRKGETDDEVYFGLKSDVSCRFKIRIKIKSADNRYLYSEYLNVEYLKPDRGKELPRYLDK